MDITSKKKHVSITFEFEDARIMERASLRPPGCLRHGQSAGHWECKLLNSAPVGGSLPTQRANSYLLQCLLKEFENMLLLAPSLLVLALHFQDAATPCADLVSSAFACSVRYFCIGVVALRILARPHSWGTHCIPNWHHMR